MSLYVFICLYLAIDMFEYKKYQFKGCVHKVTKSSINVNFQNRSISERAIFSTIYNCQYNNMYC